MGNTIWRTEPISVEKLLDDLRVAVWKDTRECMVLAPGFDSLDSLRYRH